MPTTDPEPKVRTTGDRENDYRCWNSISRNGVHDCLSFLGFSMGVKEMNVVPIREPETATFDDFWNLQFHKTGKVLCMAKWNEIVSEGGCHTKILDKTTGKYVDAHLKATPVEIVEGQRRVNSAFFERHGYDAGAEKQYVRRPIQFLNQGGWLDE